jgi:hypothetical protein
MIGFPFGGQYCEKAFLQDLASVKAGVVVEAMFHPGPREIERGVEILGIPRGN